MSAEPQQAAKEVLAGEPQAAARRWLGPTVLVMFVLFAIDTYFVVTRATLPFDIPVTTFIQQTNWGPLVYPLELINGIAGYLQVLVGVIAIVGLLVLERRAGWPDGDRQHFKLDRLCLETCHLETAAPGGPRSHSHAGDGLQLPKRARRLFHLDELHAGCFPGAKTQAGISGYRLGARDHGHRADMSCQGLGRGPLAQRPPWRRPPRGWMVGIRPVAARTLAAVAEFSMVSRAVPTDPNGRRRRRSSKTTDGVGPGTTPLRAHRRS